MNEQKMHLKLMKFGGSALATPDGLKRAAARVCSVLAEDPEGSAVVVVDAMGDALTQLDALSAQVVSGTPSPYGMCERELDLLRSTSETMSAALLSMAINATGRSAIALTGWQARVKTDNVYGRASITGIDTSRIQSELSQGRIAVITGSQGITEDGDIATLGRDGADISAVAIAMALGLKDVEIFTDTDGLFTADPRVVPMARQVPSISYDEMLELTTLGAMVVHPTAIEYAKRGGITLHIRSGFTALPGTIVKEDDGMQITADVRGVAHDTNVTKLALVGIPDQPGIAFRVFEGLSGARINVDMIVQSQKDESTNDILFTVPREEADRAMEIVKRIGTDLNAKTVARDDKVAKVSIVGAGMANNSGVAAKMFGALAKRNINIEVISTSEIRVSCLIPAMKVEEAVRAIHAEFGLQG